MYTAIPAVRTGTYPDLWRKGRYRVELDADVALNFEDLDLALRKLGYRVADADQYGLSYSHSQDSRQTAELDQPGDQPDYLRVKLTNADLDQASVQTAEDYLASIYDGIYRLVLGQNQELNDDLLDDPFLEEDWLRLSTDPYKKGI